MRVSARARVICRRESRPSRDRSSPGRASRPKARLWSFVHEFFTLYCFLSFCLGQIHRKQPCQPTITKAQDLPTRHVSTPVLQVPFPRHHRSEVTTYEQPATNKCNRAIFRETEDPERKTLGKTANDRGGPSDQFLSIDRFLTIDRRQWIILR